MPMTEVQWQDLALEAGRVFSPTAPIDERTLFAGRDHQVRLVVDAINQKGQHAIIYGERGVGKTSLANVLSSFLGDPELTIASPRINCDAKDTFDSVWKKILEEIELLQKTRAMRFRNQVDLKPIKAIELLPKGRVTTNDVRQVLTLLSQASLPILIVDEFDRLPPKQRQPFADTIKTLSDHAVGATVILVGVAESVEQLVHEHASVERALVQIRMPRMSTHEIERIIETGMSRLGMEIDSAARRRITVLAQGLPHYAHLMGLHASRAAIDATSRRVTADLVGKAIRAAIDGAQESN